ncbi:hypothetical protein D3C85_1412190 [compost metagenome]
MHRHPASVIQCRLTGRVPGVFGNPGFDFGPEQLLAAPVVMDQVRALFDLHAAIGRDRQAELLKGISPACHGKQFVDQGNGVVKHLSVLLMQADHAGVEQHHLIVRQASVPERGRQRTVEHIFFIGAVSGVVVVAQQGAGLHAIEQFDR